MESLSHYRSLVRETWRDGFPTGNVESSPYSGFVKERGGWPHILRTFESDEMEGSGNGAFLYRAP